MRQSQHHWPIYGHDWAVEFLRKSMTHGRNRHAYLITGMRDIGKMQLAHAFAMALNCTHDDPDQRPCGDCASCQRIASRNHPDMLYSQQDEKTGALKIDAIRTVTQALALKPFSSRYRVAIFENFDQARPQAQDALLKTLEEPSPYAVLILLAPSTETIMPTITSRCQLIPLRPVSQALVADVLRSEGADDDYATWLARLSSGRIGWALNALYNEQILNERDDMLEMLEDVLRGRRVERFAIAEDLDKLARKDKTAVRDLLEMWQTYWRDVLLLTTESPIKPCHSDRLVAMQQLLQRGVDTAAALKALRATRHMLQETLKTNASVRMALEVLFLDYPGL